MNKGNKKKIKTNGGAAMLVSVVFFLFISLAIISGLVTSAVVEFKNSNMSVNSKRSYFLAESGGEDALYRLLNNKPIDSAETITLGGGSVTTTIESISNSRKEIASLGNLINLERRVKMLLKTGDGVMFKYGTQAGAGGFYLKNNALISGSVYSNGNIVGSPNARVNGNAYVAGNDGLISGMHIGWNGTGDAHASSVTGSVIEGSLYCQSGSGNNKFCDTSESNPLAKKLPISDEFIEKWKNDASLEVTSGNVTISTPTTLGPMKIVGNLTINNTLTIADTIYVTGNIIINEGTTVRLDPSYQATSGIVVADGYIIIDNGVDLRDSGTAGSYILLLSDSVCDGNMMGSPCNGNKAIEIRNNSSISIVNAQKGTVYFSQNARVKEAVGNKIELKNNVTIDYGTGSLNVDFTSGPVGAWGLAGWGESE